MAEFKLGRIRFVWQGDWSASRAYVADDVVSFGGKSYICIRNHTSSSAFNTDFDNEIPKWEVVSDGTSWQGEWQPEVEYAPGDVVKYGSLVYICETGHVSATFEAPDYLGLEENLSDWTPFATSFDWKSAWTSNTRYKINDLVKYGSYVYLCTTAHISAATEALGLEDDQGNWELFSSGLIYLGDWTTGTRYRVNDVVKYGGNVFICTAPHTSNAFLTDETNWDVFIEGFQFEDSWNNSTIYQIGDTVTYGGYVYVAKTNNSNAQPTASPADWEVFTTGFAFQGDWDSQAAYKVGDVVRLGGTTYVSLADNVDITPPNETYWSRLNSGINWTNSTETFSQVSGTNESGSGSGARFDIIKSKTVYTVSVSTGFAGTGYAANDVILIKGNAIGGTTPANDLTVTVTGVTAGAIDTVTHAGYSSTWLTNTNYYVGDVVIYGASSFICTATHTSETANRPDNDLTADYWNLLTLGSEALSLSVEGDMVYYGNNGPTRLPIGVDGQILRSSDGFPEWANYGLIDNVVYVGPLGTDVPAPESGLTIDKPWASVRYALDQVRDGYLNPQTKQVLRNNKQFIMKELTNWIAVNYKVIITSTNSGTRTFKTASTENLSDGMPIVFDGSIGGVTAGTTYYVDAITSSTTFRVAATPGGISISLTTDEGIMEGNLSYNSATCERDAGLVIDALAYDISRGGTLKMTNATNKYYNRAGNEYLTDNLTNQKTVNVESFTKLKEIVATVLNNQSPVNFQSQNGIVIEERAQQVIDLNVIPEDTGKAKANDLMNLLITGIGAESNTAIPLPVLPNTTVFLKTGTYNEVLPMILPEYTAMVGDELRTSVVQPQPAIKELASDKNKTTSALNRIKDVVPDILQNVAIEKSANNTVDQGYLNGYAGNTTSTNRLNNGIEEITNILENGLDVISDLPDVGTTPTSGTNNASDTGFANAIAQIEANRDFIVAEQTAWIQFQVDNVLAPFAADFTFDTANCERDTKYIIDALRYDLTYGGNLETTVAARSYFVDGNPVYGTGKKEETLATYAHLKSIIGDVITETPIVPTSGNSLTQDTDGTAGSAGAETFAEARVQEIYDTIDNDGTLPTPIAPDTTWVASTLTSVDAEVVAAKTSTQESVIDHINSTYGPNFTYDSAKCRRDTGILLTNSAYDTALETNYNSVRDGLAYRRAMSKEVIENQLTETVDAITQAKALTQALMSDPTAITRNNAYWDEVIDIAQNGEANADAIVWSGGSGNGDKTTARTELQTNRATIISDLTTWIDTNFPNLDYDSATCERDAGRIVDALSYDVQYGGNSATYDASLAYYVGYAEVLPVGQRAASAAAMEQLKTITASYMTGATEEAEVATLLDILVNLLETGSKVTLPTKTYPSITWVSAAIQTDADAVIADTTVVPAVLQHITDTHTGFVYNHAKCSRDIGYIIDALRYDMLFGSKFRSIKSGMAYRRGLASTEVVLEDQLVPTLGSIEHTRHELKEITTKSNAVRGRISEITDILANGTEPTSFTISDPTGYDTGFFNARRLVVANKTFLQDEVEAYMNTNYNSLWTSLSAGDQAKCTRDMGYIVDALQYDLTYRGNLETIVVARSYYSNGVFVEPSNQKTAAIAVQERLAAIIDDIATGVAITPSAGNVTSQDTSGTAGSAGAAAFAVDRITEIKNTIDTGLLPAIINPATDWVDPALGNFKLVIDSRKAIIQQNAIEFINYTYPTLTYDQDLCSRDVGYILDALVYDIIFGSDFRSAKAGLAYRRGITSTDVVLNSQLEPTISTVEFIEEQLLELTKSVVSNPGSTTISERAYNLVTSMNNVVQNGLEALPGLVFPTAPAYNTADYANEAYATTSNVSGSTDTYGNAAEQLVVNSVFMQQEVRKWLEDSANGFDTIWGTISVDGQDRCIRDVGYIIDAIRYDLTYGGNTQSLIAGSAYYSNFVLTISIDEIPATLGAYARLREIIGEVIAETTVTTSPGVTETQDTTGTPGNAASVEFAQDRLDDILDYINNGNPNDTIEIATDWAPVNVASAYNRIVDRKTELVEDTVYWVEKFHQELEYNQETCRRDANLIVDAIARDVYTGSNFAVTKTGMAYYRQIASAEKTVANELYATVGSLEFLAQKVKHVATIAANASVELLIDDITSYINGGYQPFPKFVAPSTADAADVAAAVIIWENKEYIQAEVIEYLAQNYPDITYSQEACKRDVGLVIDALRYDLTYGGESAISKAYEYYYVDNILQIDQTDQTATAAAFDYIKNIATGLAVNTISSPGALQSKVEPIARDELQLTGDAGSVARVEYLMTMIYDLLGGSGDQGGDFTDPRELVVTEVTSNVFTSENIHNLEVGNEIRFDTSFDTYDENGVFYVKTVPTSTTFTLSQYFNGVQATFTDTTDGGVPVFRVTRTPSFSGTSVTLQQQFSNITGSLGAIKTAVTQFIKLNYPTLNYDVAKCERDVGLIVDAVGKDMLLNTNYLTTIAANAYYRGTQAQAVLEDQRNATVQAFRELKNTIVTYLTGQGSGGAAGEAYNIARKRINSLMDIVIKMLDKGNGKTPEIHGSITYFNDRERINAVDILKANRNFLANEATAWIEATFGGTVTEITGSPGSLVFSSAHNLEVNDPIVFDNNAFGGAVAGQTYYVSNVVSTTEVEVSETSGGEGFAFTGGTGSSVVTYAFDRAACRRDMTSYLDAIIYDLQFQGNHKSWKAAELYLNAVNGSERSDMIHVRNATGVRNMTLNGLRGNLTELNEFGTRRPTAGAYTSLDPGFGPNDEEAWVTNKSCYVQNVSTFGVGCVGCKIDGALHSGGNRSIVSNDFTQILSDGIGVWCSGNNSLTELVSVFAYYNYSGYLADFGGRIRATNGNSSYGTYGVIAEGTDTGEVANTSVVDNLAQDALIYSVLTDGEEKVLAYEFSNAGRDYTNVAYAISGAGFNAAAIDDEFRDQAVVESRVIDLNDGNNSGGADYVTAQNVAQGGDAVTLQLAATDFALSNAYNGMNAQITAGTGVGQYATILEFNNGTKNAKVYKESFDNLTITASVATGNLLTVASTDTLYVDMPIYLSAAIGGLNANTAYYITNVVSSTQFTVSDSEGGVDLVLTNETKNVTLYAAGWDHVIQGTTIEPALDLTTGYTIEPRMRFAAPGFTTEAATSSDGVDFGNMIYANNRYIAIEATGTTTNYSTDGITWAAGGAMPASANWTDVAFGGGTGATATAVIGGLGGTGAVLEAELGELNSIGLPGPTQIARVNVIDGGRGYLTPPTIVFTATLGGGGASAVATVKDGAIQEIIITSTGAGYAAAPTVTADTDKLTEVIVNTYGSGYINPPTVTISGGGASTQASVTAILDNTGVQTITINLDGNDDPLFGEGYTDTPTVTIVDDDARWVAIANGSTNNANLSVLDEANTTWTAGTALPNANFTGIAYGNGTYVTVGGTGGSGSAATSTNGSTWVSRSNITLSSGSFVDVAYGGITYVAITNEGVSAYSTNGISWTEGGALPGIATTWNSITYGNGRFVALATDGTYAISIDAGLNWTTLGTTLNNLSTSGWNNVEYGQGLFLAQAAGTSDWAISQDGIHWKPKVFAGTDSYNAFAFGNPDNTPIWAALSAAADTDALAIYTGATAIGRTYTEDGRIIATTIREAGSGYPVGAVVSSTAPNTIELDSTRNMYIGQPITFEGAGTVGLDSEILYYVAAINGTDIEVSQISGAASLAVETIVADSLTGATFQAGPLVTVQDPNSTVDVAINPRIRNGVLGQPTFTNRGTGYTTATAELGGDGYADLYQPSTFIAMRGLYELPEPGSNVEFANIPGSYYKLVTISNVIGQAGAYTATFQISPGLTVLNAPKDGTAVVTTNKYSQVRLTGHDFLYIGTGNQAETNYPYVDITTASIDRQQLSSGGGRVFFTSTDQDGNFNVGGLFGVQQSTGTATLDADAFNLAGLQSLQINGLGLGIGSAIITQFSTDPFFTENSDNIVPTQRAIKSYITAQIGGGQSSLNVNTLTAGTVFIANDEITTTSGGQLNIKAKMNFTGGVDGAPVALGYFLSR